MLPGFRSIFNETLCYCGESIMHRVRDSESVWIQPGLHPQTRSRSRMWSVRSSKMSACVRIVDSDGRSAQLGRAWQRERIWPLHPVGGVGYNMCVQPKDIHYTFSAIIKALLISSHKCTSNCTACIVIYGFCIWESTCLACPSKKR